MTCCSQAKPTSDASHNQQPGENASNLSEEAKLAGNFWSLGLSALGSNGTGNVCIDVYMMWILNMNMCEYVYIYNINLQIYMTYNI